MLSTRFLALVLLTTTIIGATHLIQPGSAGPVTSPRLAETAHEADLAKHSSEELKDLNETISAEQEEEQAEDDEEEEEADDLRHKAAASSFVHRDEDMLRVESNLKQQQSLKYDVEILEAEDTSRPDVELEERYKGAAIALDTDTFFAEDIEMHGGGGKAFHQSHLVLTAVLVVLALVSIGLYSALVMWRSHLEQRYGMRELLVTEDDYCQQSSNHNNNDHNNQNDNNNEHDRSTSGRSYAIVQL